MKSLIPALMVALLNAGASRAAQITITAPPTALPGSTVVVNLSISGGEAINGIDLLLKIGDGGPLFGGTTTSPPAPSIVSGNLTGGIFAGHGGGTRYLNLDPVVAYMNKTASIPPGFAIASGFLGTFTLSVPNSSPPATYPIILDPDNTFAGGQPVQIVNTSIQILPVPEATTALLALTATPFVLRRNPRRGIRGALVHR